MKKVFSILVVLCMMFALVPSVGAADYNLAINNNAAVMVGSNNAIAWNTVTNIPVAPVEENGNVLVPVAFLSSAFGGTFGFAGNVFTINMGSERIIQMIEGNRNVVVNGKVYDAPVAPRVINGQYMLEVNFLAETVLGKHVYYDEATKMAVVTHRKCLSSRDKDAINTIAGAITSGVLPEIVISAPVVEFVQPGGGSLGNVETGKLSIASAVADQEPEPENNVQCMIDGNMGSRWASQGAGSATIDLGSAKPVTEVKVAVWRPNERSTNYSIEVSSNGSSYDRVFDGASSGAVIDTYPVNDTIRYVRINTNGTSAGDWASILELEVWNGVKVETPVAGGGAAGTVVAAPSGSKVTLSTSMVVASQTPEPGNHAGNLIDGDKNTVWAASGPADVTVDLGSAKKVSAVGVAMKLYADDRTIPYDISTSTDGAYYSKVWEGSSEMFSDATKYVSIGADARYIKISVAGSTVSGWSSVAELEVYSSGAATGGATTTTTTTTTTVTAGEGSVVTDPVGKKVTLTSTMLKASQTPEVDNHSGNLIDGDKNTVWASTGEADVVIDLGSAKDVSTVGVAMKLYADDRTIPYNISVSADGVTYTKIWEGSSTMFSDALNYISTASKARYVKVTAFGNTVSGWNSVAEIEVYTK